MASRQRHLGLAGLTALLLSASQLAYALPPTVPKGCFSSPGKLTSLGTYTYQSIGYCQQECVNQGAPVMALYAGSTCYCGDMIPAASDSTNQYDCSSPCQGYNQQSCGGPDSYGVYLTGLSENVKQEGSDDSSSSSSHQKSTTTAPVQVVTVGGSTIVSTIPPPPTSSSDSDDSSSSGGGLSTGAKVGIAVAVVGGLVALAAVIAFVVFYLKRRNADGGSSYHRNTPSVNGFVSAGVAPAGSLGSASDTRLERNMVERRNSDDSVFADNQDYSRRILKVTNPSRDSRYD